jgi:ZIP family zinc transporter
MDFQELWLPLLLTVIAGLSTGIGSLISLFIKEFKKSYLRFSLGLSAGVMIYVSFAELLPGAIEGLGFLYANFAFFGGILFIMAIDFCIPHSYIEEHAKCCKGDHKLMSAGRFTAIGIAIHNFPEGMAVFISSMSDISLGLPLAFAIAVHNIPEGIAVAMPVYYATKSRKKAFWYSMLSGVAEPVGALVAALFLMPFITPSILAGCLAFVAGIMVFISFDELLPLTFKDEKGHTPIIGIIFGMALMAFSLYLF